MKSVLLINKIGLGYPLFAVSGKSGKLYGHATLSPEHGGVIFEMPVDQYERDKYDIVGNTAIMQQWVPSFQETPSPLSGMKWNELVRTAKEKGLNTFGKNRVQVESMLAGKK